MNVFAKATLLALFIAASYSIEQCKAQSGIPTLFLEDTETRLLDLTNFIRGFNLKFNVEAPSAKVYPSVQEAASQTNAFGEYSLVRTDVLVVNGNWPGAWIALSQKDSSNIMISEGYFKEDKQAPVMNETKKYVLPQNAKCYDAKILNSNYDAILNCFTEVGKDYICYHKSKQQKLTCQQFFSLSQPVWRKSAMLMTNGYSFLLSASSTADTGYIAVYNMLNEAVEFNMIIDAFRLKVDSLLISDVVTIGNYIAISDISANNLFLVTYLSSNRIDILQTVAFAAPPVALYIDFPSFFVATNVAVTEHHLPDLALLNSYELDSTDKAVISVRANHLALLITTTMNNYIIQRGASSMKQALAMIPSDGFSTYLSPYSMNVYSINKDKSRCFEIHPPYLSLNTTGPLEIKATSGSLLCSVTIPVMAVTDQIAVKQKISNSKIDSKSKFTLQLKDYFGGNNLNYTSSNGQVHHANSYSIDFTAARLYNIIEINSTAFYYVALGDINLSVTLYKMQADGKFDSKVIKTLDTKGTPSYLTNYKTTMGEYIVVWYLQGQNNYNLLSLTVLKPASQSISSQYALSSITMNDLFVFITFKTSNTIIINNNILCNKQSRLPLYLTQSSFTDLPFYPRETYTTQNQRIFQIKSINTLLTCYTDGVSVRLLSKLSLGDKYYPDWQWVVGKDAVLTLLYPTITKYSMFKSLSLFPLLRGANSTMLSSNGMAYVRTISGTTLYLRVNDAGVDTEYYQISSSEQFVVSGNWLLRIPSGTVHYVEAAPTVTFNESLSDGSFKDDVTLSITVKGSASQVKAESKVTVVNHPMSISALKMKDLIVLPNLGGEKMTDLNMNSYFNGTRSNYQISCDICNKGIFLLSPFRNGVPTPVSNPISMVPCGNSRILVLTTTQLILMETEVIFAITLPKKCFGLDYRDGVALVVSMGQILEYKVNESSIEFTMGYPLKQPIDYLQKIMSTVVKGKKRIGILQFGYIYMYDSAFNDIGSIDSKEFKCPEQATIVDFLLNEDEIMVVLGEYGLGYARGYAQGNNLETVFKTSNSLNLRDEATLQKYLLQGNRFVSVRVVDVSDVQNAQIFLTTSISLHLTLTVSFKNSILSYVSMRETYYRYDNLNTTNWQEVTPNSIYIGYTDATPTFPGTTTTYVFYTRGVNQSTATLTVPMTEIIPLKLNDRLYVANATNLAAYELSQGFDLFLNYTQVQTLTQIDVLAKNSVNKAQNTFKVQFADGGNDGSVKWYVILIIVAVVLLAVGIAFGLYFYMRKRKQKNSVSLVTEGEEEVDEQV